MPKTILIALLAVVSMNTTAKWFDVASSDTTTAYVDPATIRKTGNVVKMWSLIDFKSVERLSSGKAYLSQKSQREYDCKEEQSRTLYFSFHSKNMGGGEIVYSDSDPNKWSPVPPGSMDERIWKMACGRK